MYKIIGGDQKEYGPISRDQIQKWLSEGRVNLTTRVQSANGGEWKPLSEFPELADAFDAPSVAAPPVVTTSVTDRKTSEMAIASLVTSLVCGPLLGLPLGIVALQKIKKSQGQLGGRGMAIAGICISVAYLVLAILAILAALLLPVISKGRERAMTIHCVSNVKQLELAVRMYSVDHDDKSPTAATWCDAIQTEVGSPKIFQCPTHTDQRCGYAFNTKLAGKKLTEVNNRTVMIFESDAGWNAAGGVELMLKKPRHGRNFVVGFADGSVQQLTQEQLVGLLWEP